MEEHEGKTGEVTKKNAEASQTLAALRDTLLPKLISGELRVNRFEAAMKAVP
jgi:hypothetical protein